MAQRAFIFDFGGVLMQTVDYSPRHAWDQRLNLPPGSVERAVHNDDSWIAAQLGRLSPIDYWADVAARLHLDAQQVQALAQDFYSGDRLAADVLATVDALASAGHPVALLSNDSLELRPRLATYGLTDFFDPLVISAEVGIMKPHPDAYLAVLNAWDLPADHAVFIDDRPENIAGAEALGIAGVRYYQQMDLAAALEPLRFITAH